MSDTTERFLCIASYEKGQDFLHQCAQMGVRPTLLTLDKLRDHNERLMNQFVVEQVQLQYMRQNTCTGLQSSSFTLRGDGAGFSVVRSCDSQN